MQVVKRVAAVIFFALCFCIVFPHLAQAKGVGPVATPQAGGFKIKFASNGQPTANLTAGAAGAGLGIAGVAGIQLTPSIVIQAAATGAISGASAGGAWGAALGAVGAVALAALPAVKEWMDSAGVKSRPDGSVAGPDPSSCSIAPCYKYEGRGGELFSSFGAACASRGSTSSVSQTVVTDAGYPNCLVTLTYNNPIYAEFNQTGIASVGGQTVVPPGPAVDIPITSVQAVQRMSQAAPTTAAVQALIDANFPPAVSAIAITVPPDTFVGNTVKLEADGSTTTETTHATWTAFDDNLYVNLRKDFKKVFPNGLSTDTKQTTTTNPDGSTSSASVTTTTSSPARTVTGSYSAPVDAIGTCGLPGGPACKIDESGTPSNSDPADKAPFDAALQNRIDQLPNITNPTDKNTSWGVMPVWVQGGTCEPWHIYTLPAQLASKSVDIDLCPIKPYADGASNLIWVAMTFFGITSMVFAAMTSRAS